MFDVIVALVVESYLIVVDYSGLLSVNCDW